MLELTLFLEKKVAERKMLSQKIVTVRLFSCEILEIFAKAHPVAAFVCIKNFI